MPEDEINPAIKHFLDEYVKRKTTELNNKMDERKDLLLAEIRAVNEAVKPLASKYFVMGTLASVLGALILGYGFAYWRLAGAFISMAGCSGGPGD